MLKLFLFTTTCCCFLLPQVSSAATVEGVDPMGSRKGAKEVMEEEYYDPWATEDGEERFLFSSTTSVTVNSSLIRAISAIIGSLLLALPLYLAYAFAKDQKHESGYGGYSKRRRHSRETGEDWGASHMHILLESFRKHELGEDMDCQLVVACEAGKNNNSNNKLGSLAKAVHSILSTTALLSPVRNNDTLINSSSSAAYVGSLLHAHEKGRGDLVDCGSCRNSHFSY